MTDVRKALASSVVHVQHPVWLSVVREPGAVAFAILFAWESLARATLATVIPLQAFALLGSAQRVSLLYFGVGLCGVAGSFLIPGLVRRIRRRLVYSLGAVLLAGAAGSLASGTLAGQAVGMMLRVLGTACLATCLNLYIMDYIERRQLIRSEPLKMFFAAGAWTVGPGVGVYLWTHVAHWVPFAVSALSALSLLGYFWFLRIIESPAVRPAHSSPPSPLRNIRRYFSQPRLLLAWLLVLGRSSWWSMFFIYAPLYAVTSGLGDLAAGLIVSAGNAVLLASPLFGWFANRIGVRRMLITAFAVVGVLTLAVLIAARAPWFAVGLLLAGTLAMVALDAVGNIPFLRAVRRHERPEMTQVFGTYRDVGDLAPPAVFSLLLKFFALPSVFAASGISMLVFAALARFLPKRM